MGYDMKKLPARKSAAAPKARKPAAARGPAAVKSPRSGRVGPPPLQVDDIRDAVSTLKRERIISAAVNEFYSNGFSNTTLEAVAERMSVTKPFIYSHFRSKSDLLAEICARGIRASLDAITRIVDAEGSATEKAEALSRAFMIAVLENQKHIAIYTREEKNLDSDDSDSINEMRREFDRKLTDLLQEGAETGEFTLEDPRLTSLAIGGIASWSYVWFRPHGTLGIEQVAERMSHLIMAMIQARPVSPSKRAPRSALPAKAKADALP